MCSVLAVVLVVLLLSSSMREWMRFPSMTASARRGGGDCGCEDSSVCGRKASTEAPKSPAAASARVASDAVKPVAETPALETTRNDAHSLEGVKRNLQAANRSGFARDQTTCRQDFVGRTQGVRTGVHWVVLDAELRGKPQPDGRVEGKLKFQPYFHAPEHAAPISQSEALRE